MTQHTWYDLGDHFCAREESLLDGGPNTHFERFAARRYNYAHSHASGQVRLVFLQRVAENPANKTLFRNGRFVWCKSLRYEGTNDRGYRQVSFTLKKGRKVFKVSEEDVLALPSNIFINNNSFFRKYNKVISSFSSVFEYREAVKIMRNNTAQRHHSLEDYVGFLASQSPFQPGALVSPRRGLFFPKVDKFKQKMDELALVYCSEKGITKHSQELANYLTGPVRAHTPPAEDLVSIFTDFNEWSTTHHDAIHPVGVVLGRARNVSPHSGRELYRVSFGDTIYEEIHPIQLEIINEV